MEELGQDISEFKNERSPNPRKSFFKLDFDDFTFDALPEIKADIKFADANQRKDTVELEATKIHFMNFDRIDVLDNTFKVVVFFYTQFIIHRFLFNGFQILE